jgi:hypothetical protein
MPGDRSVTIRIPEALLAAVVRAARAEEMTAAEFMRAALAERLAELDLGGARDPVGLIRRALRRQFSEAADWLDLQRRLRAEGFVLREVEGELWLFTWPVERRLVRLERVGPGREDLTLLYRAPFPAHGAASVTRRAGRRAA